jgi:hypothetical protein
MAAQPCLLRPDGRDSSKLCSKHKYHEATCAHVKLEVQSWSWLCTHSFDAQSFSYQALHDI